MIPTRILTLVLAAILGAISPLQAADCTDRGPVRFASALLDRIVNDWRVRRCAVSPVAFDACMRATSQLFEQGPPPNPIELWNDVMGQGGWGQLGPRQLVFGEDLLGDVRSRGARFWIAPHAVPLESMTVKLEKRHGEGRTDVTVCKHVVRLGRGIPLDATPVTSRVWSATIEAGRDNIGRIYLQDIPVDAIALISVHLQGKSLAKQMAYTLHVTPHVRALPDRKPSELADAGEAIDRRQADAGDRPTEQRVPESTADLVESCGASLPSSAQKTVRGPRRGLDRSPVPTPVGPAPNSRRASPGHEPEPIVAFTPSGGWVIASGTRSFARNLPDEAYERLHDFTDGGKTLDAIAFTPTGGWTIAAENGYWTRNVGGAYHDTVGDLIGGGRRVRDVAFNPLAWDHLRGFVIAHDQGFIARHVPREMCERLTGFTEDGRAIDAIEFTPSGGWAVVAEGGYWTRNVGGSYHGAVGVLIGEDRRVRDIAFRTDGEGVAGWTILTDETFYSDDVPAELRHQLSETLRLEDRSP